MYTIGIAGYSGSGKTTVANSFGKKLNNSKVFEGDAYMYKSFIDMRKKAEELLGTAFLKPDGTLSFTCVITSGIAGHEYMKTLCPYISKNLFLEREKARKEGYKYFIVDWQALTVLDFWKLCDKKIVVENIPEIRYKMLSQRPIHGCSVKMAQKREDFFRYAFNNLGEDVIHLFNDYNLEKLNEKIDEIVCEINKINKSKDER